MDIGINLTEAIEETNSPFGSPNQTAVSEAATKQHVLQQAKLSRQLQELNAMLSKKEQLMSQMVKSDDQMNSIKEQYEVCKAAIISLSTRQTLKLVFHTNVCR